MAVDVDGDVLEAAQFAHDPGNADPGGVLEVVSDGQDGIISDATVMSKPSSHGIPLTGLPKPTVTWRRTRSFRSTTRF